jgi:outer membrane protein OmpA-like peptidoglycan-associated protein
LFSAAVAAFLALPSIASAQEKTFYLDRLRMAGAPDDGIGIWRPQMGKATRFYGQLGVGFSLNPLRIANYVDTDDQSAILERESGPPVSSQLITYFTAGAEIADRLAFQASFPLAIYQTGNTTISEEAQIREEVNMKAVAPMDLRLDGRLILFRTESRSFKLALQAALFLPTGSPFSFGSDGTSGSVGLGAEYDAKVVAVALNAGYHVRPIHELNDLRIADELTYGVGAFVPLAGGKYRLGAQIFGSAGMGNETTGDIDNIPLEWMAEGRMRLGNNPGQGWVGLGAGSRLTAGYAPDFRAVAVVGGWFPLDDWEVKNDKGFTYKIPGDADNDRLPDDIDMCPTDSEDGKGSNPDDGCPELLNDLDSDGVPDSQDACPKEPGVQSADPAKNGCPEFIRRMKGSATIEVLREVQFAFDRADLLPPAFPILNEVVRLLRVNPDIELVSIEGHTDDMGSHQHNDELSGARAKSVMNYLIQRGIAADRLESKGFGKRKPIADNTSAEGRQKNRRVEFHIIKVKGGPAAQPGETPAGSGQPVGTPPGTAPAGTPPGTTAPAGTAPGTTAPGTTPAAPAAPGTTPVPAGPAAPAGAGKGATPAPAPAAPAGTGKGAAPAPAPATPAGPGKGATTPAPVKQGAGAAAPGKSGAEAPRRMID